MTMVEKVADAMDAVPEWPAKTYRDRVARAALEAMREPTPEMLEAMHTAMYEDKFDGTNLPALGAGFEAAIDAALAEGAKA